MRAFLLFCTATSLFAAHQPATRLRHHIDDSQTFRLRGHVRPALALARDLGAVSDSQTLSNLSIHFSLTPAQQADLARLQSELQDPTSKQFHKFLTPEQYGARFGLNTSDLEKITRWLEQSGFSNVEVARSRNWVSFSGTAGQVQAVFHTALHRYSINGEEHFANSTDPSLPKALDGMVKGMLGLHNFRLKPDLQARPLYTFSTQAHGLTPDDFATIYDLKPIYNQGLDGTGVKIAVLAQSNVNLSDVQTFRSLTGLPANDPQVILVSTDPGIQKDDAVESDLDLEWAGGIAKNATLLLVVGNPATGSGIFGALAYTVEHNLAPVVSLSYGACEADFNATEYAALTSLLAQAATQGITIVAASGDSGPASCDVTAPASHGPSVTFPASSQYVTGVGGTVFDADISSDIPMYWSSFNNGNAGSALAYIREAVWNDQDPSGSRILVSGGGASTFTSKPAWQVGPGVPDDGARDVPDVAFSASPFHDPYLMCAAGSCVNGFADANGRVFVAGGTSASTPGMAAIAALLVQKTGEPQGNINPRLYAIATSYPNSFHDITQGNNHIPCDLQSSGCTISGLGYQAGIGYDQATGLGSLDASNLLNAWPDFGLSSSTASLSINRGSSGAATINVSRVNGFDEPLTLSCNVAASLTNVTCSIPSAPSSSGTAVLTITAGTTAQAPLSSLPPLTWNNTSGAATLFIVLSTFVLWHQRRTTLFAGVSVSALLLTVAFTTASCGSGSASGATVSNAVAKPAPQTGSVTITATGRQSSKSVSVTVTVQ